MTTFKNLVFTKKAVKDVLDDNNIDDLEVGEELRSKLEILHIRSKSLKYTCLCFIYHEPNLNLTYKDKELVNQAKELIYSNVQSNIVMAAYILNTIKI